MRIVLVIMMLTAAMVLVRGVSRSQAHPDRSALALSPLITRLPAVPPPLIISVFDARRTIAARWSPGAAQRSEGSGPSVLDVRGERGYTRRRAQDL